MKIAIFTESFLPGVGGTENAVLQYATELSKTDEVLVVAPDYHRFCDDEAFPFKVVREKSIAVTHSDMWAMPDVTAKLKKTLDEFDPDVIHCQHWGMSSGFANKYAKLHNIPLVYVIHTKFMYCYKQHFIPPIPYLFVKNGMRRLKKADKVCAVSYSMAQELNSYGNDKPVTVIRNGLAAPFNRESLPARRQDGVFRLLFVGLLIDYKNVGFALEALAELKRVRNDFTFYIVGNGPQKKKFQKMSEKLGLSENVVFTGIITDKKELVRMYVDADLFIFPSVIDSDGLVVAEAAFCGTPSLVLKNTGAAERIIDNENGFVSDYSVSAFADRISQIMDDKQHLFDMRKNGISVGNGWDKTVLEYKKVYTDLITEKERSGEYKKVYSAKYKKRVKRVARSRS